MNHTTFRIYSNEQDDVIKKGGLCALFFANLNCIINCTPGNVARRYASSSILNDFLSGNRRLCCKMSTAKHTIYLTNQRLNVIGEEKNGSRVK